MGLLLHAITSLPEGLPPHRADLQVHRVGELSVWATPLSNDHAPFTKEAVLENHRIVSDIFAIVRSCLPVRFPTEVQDLGGLDVAALVRQLEGVRDACEVAVTATWRPPVYESTPPVTATTPGRRYLQQRQAAVHRRERAEHLAEDLLKLSGASVLAESRAVCPSDKLALSLALLIPRADAEAAMARLPRSAQDVRILVNGPWPPYTFAAAGFEQRDGRGARGTQA